MRAPGAAGALPSAELGRHRFAELEHRALRAAAAGGVQW